MNRASTIHRLKLSLPAVKLSLPIFGKEFAFHSSFLEFQNIAADIQILRHRWTTLPKSISVDASL
jgi:hypothetical protein